jgi:nucleoside-diphosphate-sugar epimerase
MLKDLRVLFLGGNGVISAGASRLAVASGADLTLMTRGRGTWRPPIDGARTIIGDAANMAVVADVAHRDRFDVVVNFQLFTAAQAVDQVRAWEGRVGQYIFISSAAAYSKPIRRWPIDESAELGNPAWKYAQDKLAAEEIFAAAHRSRSFPVTIVRPSHTYDPSLIPLPGQWTMLARALRGRPIIVHGDGTSIWTLTHQDDFARGLVGLAGNHAAIGEAVHITTDAALTWDSIAEALTHALGVEAQIVHIASDTLAHDIPEWGPPLLGDWSHSELYDNSKIKTLVPDFVATTPFTTGAQQIVDWHLADVQRQVIDIGLDRAIDNVIDRFG